MESGVRPTLHYHLWIKCWRDEHFISFRNDVLPDDGLIQQSDLRLVMKACMEENGMKFDEKEIEDLVSRYNRELFYLN